MHDTDFSIFPTLNHINYQFETTRGFDILKLSIYYFSLNHAKNIN